MRNNNVRIFELADLTEQTGFRKGNCQDCVSLKRIVKCELEFYDLSCCQKHYFHLAEHWLPCLESVMGGICLSSVSHKWGYHCKTGTVQGPRHEFSFGWEGGIFLLNAPTVVALQFQNRIVPRLNCCFWKNTLPGTLYCWLFIKLWPTKHPFFYRSWEIFSARHRRVGPSKNLSVSLSKYSIWNLVTYTQMDGILYVQSLWILRRLYDCRGGLN